MASLTVIASLLVVASGVKTDSARALALSQATAQLSVTFEEYVSTHHKTYSSHAEYMERQAIFEQRRSAAKSHNNRSGATWIATVNKFSDHKQEELNAMHGYKPSRARTEGLSFAAEEEDHMRIKSSLPEKVDWRKLRDGKVIAEQGACGSCWAIAASTTLNAHSEIHRGEAKTFSSQELVNCVPNPEECGGQGGCAGATVELALGWAVKNGISEEREVPYSAKDGSCGKKDAFMQLRGAQNGGYSLGLRGFRVLPSNKELPLAKAVAEQGPVAVSVAANNWFSYYSGVFDDCDNIVNHAVTMYGYGKTNSNQKYWLIKNSWGADWGEAGYIRILRHENEDEHCGIDNDPQKGTACKGDPTKEITVCGTCGILYDSVVPEFENSL
mmetsp:Transcript_101270/g.179942  ORF Transcript_101270/g.179942 Transcript_101270/m.179942 type:complete len:385 (-) Transcript_101270:69-1223(-)|eukprot:CAMPEP_0197661334 /NCGR_PEP_ID=MMETSP1338-20131121/51391_1 /TAXON_ID=43686 ORGANISM="Pelagodinium beii, Strain RCC1491" /NCGR_SAMPLE_ID=MMETSP1338 /ASSEMBLY_ACC=CAM_ASM_000754 /LENGTH=384 /DNA_ID=CAMNT_0043238871 /DNA_START=76 /DNA_END=1230 /DNA_ORIENTATION=+